jgi:hypothetical protein
MNETIGNYIPRLVRYRSVQTYVVSVHPPTDAELAQIEEARRAGRCIAVLPRKARNIEERIEKHAPKDCQ